MHESGLNPSVSLGKSLPGYLNFTANKTSVGLYEYVSFTATVPAGATSVLWLFGDGTSSNALSPLKNYTTAGVYTVTLITIDGTGRTRAVYQTAYITVSNVVTNFLLDAANPGMSGTLNGGYSFRKLYSAATYCVRLRRSTDQATMDFGFTSAGYLDTAAVNTWLGTATGYVVIWYDQTGISNAQQTLAASQPQIAFDSNGFAYLKAAPTTGLVIGLAVPVGVAKNWVLNGVCKDVNESPTNNNMYAFFGRTQTLELRTSSLGASDFRYSPTSSITLSGVSSFNIKSLTATHDTSSNIKMWMGGLLQSSSTTNSTIEPNGTIILNTIGDVTSGAGASKYIYECICLLNTSDNTYLYPNQHSYYGAD